MQVEPAIEDPHTAVSEAPPQQAVLASLGQPSYCRTCKPAFQSLTYISPSGIASTSHVIAHLATFGRGSMRRVGTGGIQYPISPGWNWFLMSNTARPHCDRC
jgi:hypothetical protein